MKFREIAIVTGASSGFGMLTALELAKSGFYVIGTMRNKDRGIKLLEEAKEHGLKDQIEVFELDVTSDKSIKGLKEYIEKLGRVDVLVNNAGYASAGFVEEIPLEEYRHQFETNFFGLIAVTQICLPFMRTQRKGKVINVSSISGMVGFPGLSPYSASKYALEGWSECLRFEMKPFGVDVALIQPGSYKTNIWSSGKHITERSLKEDSPYYLYMKKIDDQIKRGEKRFGDPQEVAAQIVEIVKKKDPSLRYPIGKGVKLSVFLKKNLSWRSWEKLFLKQLK